MASRWPAPGSHASSCGTERRFTCGEATVDREISVDHFFEAETPPRDFATGGRIERSDGGDRIRHLALVVDEKARPAVLDDFGQRARPERDYRRPAGQRLHRDEAAGLRDEARHEE